MFGVLLAQARERVDVVGLPTVKLPGAMGAVATCTIAVMVLVPFAFVAVRVYVVVEVGFTVVDPMRVLVLKLPGVMATLLAFVTFQERVLVPAEATTVGEAEKEEMVGGGPASVVALASEEVAETVPTPFVAETA